MVPTVHWFFRGVARKTFWGGLVQKMYTVCTRSKKIAAEGGDKKMLFKRKSAQKVDFFPLFVYKNGHFSLKMHKKDLFPLITATKKE